MRQTQILRDELKAKIDNATAKSLQLVKAIFEENDN